METKLNNEGPAVDGAFLAMLQNHRRGGCLHELARALREVTSAVDQTGKGGKLTLTVKVRPATVGGALTVEDEIKTTLPKTAAEGSIFYSDDEGNLLREDPNQKTLELRTLDGAKQEQQPEPLRKVAIQS